MSEVIKVSQEEYDQIFPPGHFYAWDIAAPNQPPIKGQQMSDDFPIQYDPAMYRKVTPARNITFGADCKDSDVRLLVKFDDGKEFALHMTPDEALLLGFDLQQAAARLKE